jgi:hypothetical protein
MTFKMTTWRDPQLMMTVSETRSEDKRTQSEIIERAPFTCDCRKLKFLKRASCFLHFGFRPCLQKQNLETLAWDNFCQCRLVLRSRRRQLVMAPFSLSLLWVVAKVEFRSVEDSVCLMPGVGTEVCACPPRLRSCLDDVGT